jgi:hypothetical protein
MAIAISCSGGADEPELGPTDQIAQAVGDAVPHDGASHTQIELDWLTPFDAPTQLSQMTLRVRNRGTVTATVGLALVSFGLDFRTVRRTLSSITVGAGQTGTRLIEMRRDQPIKGISYSSDTFVEARLVRPGLAPLVIDSPHVYNHYSSDYSTMTAYGYDVMIASFSGGQLTNDAFDLRGQVLDGAEYADIGFVRQREAKELGVALMPAAGPRVGTSPGWGPEQGQPVSGSHTVCVDWKTKFVDNALNEDYAPGDGEQAIDASYGRATIVKVLQSPCPMPPGGSGCTQTIWTGYLNSSGCVSIDLTPLTQYALWLDSTLKKGNAIFNVDYVNNSLVDKGIQTYRMNFVPAPPGSPLPPPMLKTSFATNTGVSAVVSRALKAPDMAIANATYPIKAGAKCPTLGVNNSCRHNGTVYIAPLVVPGHPGVKGDAYWKFVIGHELGHSLQAEGMGTIAPTYTFPGYPGDPDPPGMDEACTCAHVDTALTNDLHCLQSWERSADAQQEGIGHFFASKMWNNPLGNDCAFVYYKEFNPDSGPTELPPIEKLCKAAAKWRNNHCDDRAGGTELDWLQFYWDINTTGSKVTVHDLFESYQALCGGKCVGAKPTWDGLLSGALDYMNSTSDPRFLHMVNSGEAFGVDDD